MPPRKLTRLDQELAEFSDPDYAWMFKSIEINLIPEPIIHVTLSDDSTWEIYRSNNYFVAPRVSKNGELITSEYDWSSALTTIRWLMMLAFSEEE